MDTEVCSTSSEKNILLKSALSNSSGKPSCYKNNVRRRSHFTVQNRPTSVKELKVDALWQRNLSGGDNIMDVEKCKHAFCQHSSHSTQGLVDKYDAPQATISDEHTNPSKRSGVSLGERQLHNQYHSEYSTAEHHIDDLVPSKELLVHYRNKIARLNRDYEDLLEKVEACQSSCDYGFQLEQDLQHRNSEVSKLQQTVSDLQVYVHQEREQVLRLYVENDKLQVQAAEDHKKIDILLSLNNITENDVTYILSKPRHGVVPKKTHHQDKKKETDKEKEVNNCQCEHNVEAAERYSKIVAAELEERVELHHNEVHSLLKDRELSKKERNVEHRRLQDHISHLSNKLKDTQDKLCDATRDLVSLKKEIGNKEIKWNMERGKLMHNLELYQERLGEKPSATWGYFVSGSGNIKQKSSQHLCAQVDYLKDQLKQRDSLISMYQEQCIQLNEETSKYREQVDVNRNAFKEQTQKLAGQVTYLKNKYNDLDRRRKLEAEGFYNDVKILRGRLQNIEKNVKKFCGKKQSPTSSELYATARDTMSKSTQLEQELKEIKRRVQDIETGISDVTKG